MDKKVISVIFTLAVIVLLSSCETNPNRPVKVRSIGKTSEILVVVENEQQWENSIGKTIRKYFGKDQDGLPQSEPLFDIAHVTRSSFSDLLKKHRNIFIVEIDKNSVEPKVEMVENHWAQPQVVVRITAPNKNLFIRTFEKNADLFLEKYDRTERERIKAVLKPVSESKAAAAIRKNFGIRMIIPEDFHMVPPKPDFVWVKKETAEFSQGFFIFKEAYMDTAQFSSASIKARINRILKQYVPGPTEGSYMTLDEKYYVPEPKVITDFPTNYAVELRGLWDVENDFMGGPYISYTFTDPENKQIYTLFGYVYHPSKEKRNLLRQVEALLYSVKFIQ